MREQKYVETRPIPNSDGGGGQLCSVQQLTACEEVQQSQQRILQNILEELEKLKTANGQNL